MWRVWIRSCRWQVYAQNQRRGRMQEAKETSYDQTTMVEERMCWHQQKLHTRCIAVGESVLQSLTGTTLADVNKIKGSKCHSVPVLQCVCMIENVSSHILLTRWNWPLTLFCFGWFMVHPPIKSSENLNIRTQAVWSTDTDRSILG